jgi:hypothetical protein
VIKDNEIGSPSSCWNRALPDERVFVLLARDVAAPAAIKAWCRERIRRGKNKPIDAQITEALECARLMEESLPSAGPRFTPGDNVRIIPGPGRPKFWCDRLGTGRVVHHRGVHVVVEFERPTSSGRSRNVSPKYLERIP